MNAAQRRNAHELPRYIPADIARQVRQRSGFGCVFCGLFICHYAHIDPDYHDAHRHDPDRICLLCPYHHTLVDDKLISSQEVLEKYARPQALSDGFASDTAAFTRLTRPCRVLLGSIAFDDPREILRVNGRSILGLRDDDGRVTLDGVFFNQNGREILRIDQNIWKGATTNWDIEYKRLSLTLRNGPADISLSVDLTPQREVRFGHLHFHIPGFVVETLENGRLRVSQPGGPCMDNIEASTKGPLVITDGRFELSSGGTIAAGTVFGPSEPVSHATAAPPGIRKVARNALCPCGSRKKYKKCCGA